MTTYEELQDIKIKQIDQSFIDRAKNFDETEWEDNGA